MRAGNPNPHSPARCEQSTPSWLGACNKLNPLWCNQHPVSRASTLCPSCATVFPRRSYVSGRPACRESTVTGQEA